MRGQLRRIGKQEGWCLRTCEQLARLDATRNALQDAVLLDRITYVLPLEDEMFFVRRRHSLRLRQCEIYRKGKSNMSTYLQIGHALLMTSTNERT